MSTALLQIKNGAGANEYVPVHNTAEDTDGTKVQTIVSLDGDVATYRAGILTTTPIATPTVAFRLIGSATKTVRLRKIGCSGIATAAGNTECEIVKRSTLGTAGSAVFTALTAAPLDSNNAAATAVASYVITANEGTPGTSVGVLKAGRMCVSADGSGVYVAPFEESFGMGGQQAVVLRSATECVTIGFNGDAVPSGGKYDYYVEWTETNEAP